MSSEILDYVPADRTRKCCAFILSNLDPDIANEFRKFGLGTYRPDSPLLTQIARNLREIVSAMKSGRIINISNASQGNNEGGNDQDHGK